MPDHVADPSSHTSAQRSPIGEILALPVAPADLKAFQDRVLATATVALDASWAVLFDVDRATGSLTARTTRGLLQPEVASIAYTPHVLAQRAADEARLLCADGVGDTQPNGGTLAAPVRADGAMIGVLCVGRRDGEPFSADEADRLRLLVDRLETGVRFDRAAVRARGDAAALRRLATEAGSGARHPLRDTLARVCEATCRFLEAAAVVVVLDRADGRAIVEASHGLTADESALWPLDPPVMVTAEHPFAEALGVRTVRTVPLRSDDEAIGLVYVLFRSIRILSGVEIEALEILAALLPVTIETARLLAETDDALRQFSAAHDQRVRTEKTRALGAIAAGIAHEFNNLLAIILGKTQLALERGDRGDVRADLGVIEETAWRAADTVRRLQTFALPRPHASTAAVDVNAIVQDVVTFTGPLWQQGRDGRDARIEVVTDLAATTPVDGDPTELQEAITNLVLNAIDAMPNGGRIAIGTRSVEGAVTVEVSDTGEGIAPELTTRIFDPFVTTRSPLRAGLGLSVVLGIAERHGGRVEVRSEPQEGTTLTLVLPQAATADVVDAAPGPAPGTILVVEDENHLRSMLVDTLQSVGHTVHGAANGREGIERFRQGAYDVVITDLSMPHGSGLDVTRAVKDASPRTPVIMITGWSDRLHMERIREGNVDLVLVKPFRVERVLNAVEDALALRR